MPNYLNSGTNSQQHDFHSTAQKCQWRHQQNYQQEYQQLFHSSQTQFWIQIRVQTESQVVTD